MLYAVTVRLKKNPDHNPKKKETGICPFNGGLCDDVTGEHHTALVMASTCWAARKSYEDRGFHVTRAEEVSY